MTKLIHIFIRTEIHVCSSSVNIVFFHFISTRSISNFPADFLSSFTSRSTPSRLPSTSELVSSVKGIQQFAAVRAGIAKGTFNADARSGQEVNDC